MTYKERLTKLKLYHFELADIIFFLSLIITSPVDSNQKLYFVPVKP